MLTITRPPTAPPTTATRLLSTGDGLDIVTVVSDCSLSVTVPSSVVIKTLLEVVGMRVESTIVGSSETAVLAVVRCPDSVVVD